MARSKDVEYERDEFDNPPAGPVGLHRGKPSAWPRAVAFLVVLLVAMVLCGVMYAYGIGMFGGRNAEERNGADTSQLASGDAKDSSAGQSSQSASADASKDSSKDAASSSQSASGNAAQSQDGKAQDSSQDKAQSSSDAQASQDQNKDQNDQKGDQSQQAAQANTATQVLVLNATATTGLAQQQAGVLQGQGYSAVTYGNASNYAYTYPAQNTVWYADESSLATAQDIAAKLGIAQVAQAQGLAQPVVVVYVG